jgi:phenylacetic acid degradation protein
VSLSWAGEPYPCFILIDLPVGLNYIGIQYKKKIYSSVRQKMAQDWVLPETDMPCYTIDGIIPVVDPTSYIHPTAVLIGDVIIEKNCYVGPCAVLRGDFGRIVLKDGANVQDTCVVHGFPETDTIIEENGHIGHGAVLHGCVVKKDALVGMNAVVMDEAEVGEQAIVAASAFVRAGMHVPPKTLFAGVPGKVIRELSSEEIDWKHEGTLTYQTLTKRCLNTMAEVIPLSHAEPDRPRIQVDNVKPLIATKRS